MKQTVKERLVEYLKFKNIGRNKFEEMAKISSGYITNLKNAPGEEHLVKILQAAPDLNRIWLLTGDGVMLNGECCEKKDEENGNSIPLIPTNAIAGYLTGAGDQIMDYDCERYIMPIFSGADFMIRVEGDSMMPDYMPGDILACMKVKDPSFFQWGKVYVIDTKQGALVKRIEPTEEDGCICLCSDNEKYKPFKLHADDINGVALVKGVIRVG